MHEEDRFVVDAIAKVIVYIDRMAYREPSYINDSVPEPEEGFNQANTTDNPDFPDKNFQYHPVRTLLSSLDKSNSPEVSVILTDGAFQLVLPSIPFDPNKPHLKPVEQAFIEAKHFVTIVLKAEHAQIDSEGQLASRTYEQCSWIHTLFCEQFSCDTIITSPTGKPLALGRPPRIRMIDQHYPLVPWRQALRDYSDRDGPDLQFKLALGYYNPYSHIAFESACLTLDASNNQFPTAPIKSNRARLLDLSCYQAGS